MNTWDYLINPIFLQMKKQVNETDGLAQPPHLVGGKDRNKNQVN